MSTRRTADDTRIESDRIGPDDPRYRAVVDKRFNKRFSARPDYVRLVSSTEQVMAAVEDAVSEGRRLVVTSGGHCLEGFVSDPEVRVIIDVSPMKRVYYDADRARRGRRGRRHGGRDVPGAVRGVGSRDSARRVSRRSAWAGMWPAAPSASSAASSVSRRTISTPSRWSPWTRADGRAAWWRRARRPTRTASSGGRIPAAAAATSASSRGTGSDRLARSGDDPASAVAARAGVDHDLQGGMELERHRSAVLPAAAQEPRHLVRAEQRRRFAVRVALDAARAPSQAVRQDHRPRREHGRRRRRAAGGRLSGGADAKGSRAPKAASWHGCPGSSSR